MRTTSCRGLPLSTKILILAVFGEVVGMVWAIDMAFDSAALIAKTTMDLRRAFTAGSQSRFGLLVRRLDCVAIPRARHGSDADGRSQSIGLVGDVAVGRCLNDDLHELRT